MYCIFHMLIITLVQNKKYTSCDMMSDMEYHAFSLATGANMLHVAHLKYQDQSLNNSLLE